MQFYFEKFSLIIQEILRLREVIKSDALKFDDPNEYLYSLRHPSGTGSLVIGRRAAGAFSDVSRKACETDSRLRGRVSPTTVEKALKYFFEKWILLEGRELTPQVADRIVGRATRFIRENKLETRTIFIPCLIAKSSDIEEFFVGPVCFQQMPRFFEDKKTVLEKYTEDRRLEFLTQERQRIIKRRPLCMPSSEPAWPLLSIHKSAEYDVSELRGYFGNYPWVASVELEKFDSATLDQLSRSCIETALHILRLFVGGAHAEKFAIGDDPHLPGKTTTFEINEDGRPGIGNAWSSRNPNLGDQWLLNLTTGDAGVWLNAAGSLIDGLRQGPEISVIYRRLVDALWWYGEAVAETRPHTKVIKFVSALEAFLCTSRKNIKKQVATRAAYLCSRIAGDEKDFGEWQMQAEKIYDARSELVHGTASPMSSDVQRFVFISEKVCRLTLMEGLSWTYLIALEDHKMGRNKLHQCFERGLPRYADGENDVFPLE